MKKIKLVSSVLFLLSLVVIFSGCQSNTATNDSQKKEEVSNVKNDKKTEEIKFKSERIDALFVVKSYSIQNWLNKGTKYQVSKGTSLVDLFNSYIDKGLVNKNARWVVLKDRYGYIVIFRSEFDNGDLNNPQWAVIPKGNDILGGEIKALNGTAIKYTPELGYQDPKLDTDNFTKARKIYLRFMEIGETAKYQEALESSDVDLRQKTEDEVMGIVAKEFGVSLSEANKMFFEGMQGGNDETKKVNNERGDILSDEKLLQLLKEQGDLYVPEN
jgi:hypothetical protein